MQTTLCKNRGKPSGGGVKTKTITVINVFIIYYNPIA